MFRSTRIALVLAAVLASGCGAPAAEDTAEVTIAATPWPLAWLASAVAPEATVAALGVAGQDAHDPDLGPADRELLQRADVVLHIGPVGYQPQVEEAAGQRAAGVVAVTDAAADPHVWFDPRALATAADALADALASVDPPGAEGYRTRAAAVSDDLRALHTELDTLLASCRHAAALVSHEAFAYLLEPRGLAQIGISGVGGHDEVSPARLGELTDLIRERGLTAVLAEPVEGRAAAEALARETGVRLLEVDSLESPPEDRRGAGYPELLRDQARTFATALECGS